MDKKRKSGAQKLKEKKAKLLMSQASKCSNLDSFVVSKKLFSNSNVNDSNPKNISILTTSLSNTIEDFSDNSIVLSQNFVEEQNTNKMVMLSTDEISNSNPKNITIPTTSLSNTVENFSDNYMVLPQTVVEEQNTNEIVMLSTDQISNSHSNKNYPVKIDDSDSIILLPSLNCVGESSDISLITPYCFEDMTLKSENNQNMKKFNFFIKPSPEERNHFFKYHPCQPLVGNFRFNPRLVFYRKDGTNRQWLTYCEKKSLVLFLLLSLLQFYRKKFPHNGNFRLNPKTFVHNT